MISDDALMLAHGRGEAGAFDALVQRYRGKVFGFLLRMVRSETLAEDAWVETFWGLHRASAGYQARGQLKNLLFRIAYREGVNVLREIKKRRQEESLSAEGARQPAALGPGPEELLDQREQSRELERAIEALPEVQRAVFLLYYREALATADIADVLEIPPGSVRAYLSMARKSLREALAQHP